MQNKLKIYTQDHSWRGVIIVTATSKTEAHAKMQQSAFHNYDHKRDLDEHEIEGFVYENMGDS